MKKIITLLAAFMLVFVTGCQKKTDYTLDNTVDDVAPTDVNEKETVNEDVDGENPAGDTVESEVKQTESEEEGSAEDFSVVFTDDGINYNGDELTYNPEDPVHLFSEGELMSKYSMDEIAVIMDEYLQAKGCKPLKYEVKPSDLGDDTISVDMASDWPYEFYEFAINSTFLVCYDPDNVASSIIVNAPIE